MSPPVNTRLVRSPVGEREHEGDERLARPIVRNGEERSREFASVGVHSVVAALLKLGSLGLDLLEEGLDRHAETPGEDVEASRPDSAVSTLVLLDLSGGNTEALAEPALAQAERHAQLAHAVPNVSIDFARTVPAYALGLLSVRTLSAHIGVGSGGVLRARPEMS